MLACKNFLIWLYPISSMAHGGDYSADYSAALTDYEEFWKKTSNELLTWSKPFTKVYGGSLGSDRWFEDGRLNACYNCVDRWVETQPDKTALIFNNNAGDTEKFTYKEVQERVYEMCHALKGLEPGECVTLYLAMSPQAVFAALACARLGLVHNFVFGGFEAKTLRVRLENSRSRMLVSQDFFRRGHKIINLLPTIDEAVRGLDVDVLIFDYKNIKGAGGAVHRNSLEGAPIPDKRPRLEGAGLPPDASMSDNLTEDSYGDENIVSDDNLEMCYDRRYRKWSEMEHSREAVAVFDAPAEHALFYLYTSGSTGMPKGLVHTTGGYLTYVAYSLKTAFAIRRETDVFCCTADIGWITGHSYCVYAPLALGITSVIMEGLPSFPSHYRFFDIVSQYKVTQLYTAPTIIRLLKAHFDKVPLDASKHDLSSLRYLGSVGEPINSEAYRWFANSFGCSHIVDTYFQTETGGILIAPIPDAGRARPSPECAGYPMPGIEPFVDTNDGVETVSNVTGFSSEERSKLGRLYIKRSWPGISRGILNDSGRFMTTYFPERGGSERYYFTGDMGYETGDSLFWIRGRADDEINVSGHRISSAEVESSACKCGIVAEAAVIAVIHKIKGQCMWLFVVLSREDPDCASRVTDAITTLIGKFAVPDKIVACPAIPKTATGKIMRRVLRAIIERGVMGDLSTCINPECIEQLQNICEEHSLYVDE